MIKDITISKQYPSYWEYNEKPVLLLGGSIEDNLFQIKDIKEHLMLLHKCGGNYVRCTMSSRDEGDVWPYKQNEDGIYNLEQFSDEHWLRFEQFLNYTSELDIIVQIEIWDRFDQYDEWWQTNPLNPKNNCNYTPKESKLETKNIIPPWENQNRFFFSVPAADNNKLLLKYQEKFVEKLLSISLNYPNVLYCMDNETSAIPEWGEYWADFIRNIAKKKGKNVHLTEMWDEWDLTAPQHLLTFDHPEIYSFCDVSQNTHNSGDLHWKGIKYVRSEICNPIRPLNTVKTYGCDDYGAFGTTRDGVERFWRNVLGGLASTRFHRPTAGLGLSEIAQKNIKSVRMLLQKINIFTTVIKDEILIERQKHNSYCVVDDQENIIIFFTKHGEVALDIQGDYSIEWLDILQSKWIKSEQIHFTNNRIIKTVIPEYQIAVLKKAMK